MPDYQAEWREIDQEEHLVREELTQALPGDPRLGPLQYHSATQNPHTCITRISI
jgi:hypothetical protein